MKKFSLILSLLCAICLLGLLAACGDDAVDDTNQSAEAKAITEEVGGPFTDSEFKDFLKALPSIPGLTAASQQDMGDAMNGAVFSAKVQAAIADAGWEQERFMYIYSHSMAIMNIEQMDQMTTQLTAQMEGMPEDQKKMMEQMMAEQMGTHMDAVKAEMSQQVPNSEQTIIRNNLDELYTVLGVPELQ